jgi:polyhydroxybutyrate depolymerase
MLPVPRTHALLGLLAGACLAGACGTSAGSQSGASGGSAGIPVSDPGTAGTTGAAGTTSATGAAGTTSATGAAGVVGAGGCGAGTLTTGERTVTLVHDGVTRNYILHVPSSYDGKKAVPLVLDIHGLTSNASQQEAISGWRSKADQQGFVVIWPNGLDSSWNGGSLCCGMSLTNHVDDEGFLRAVVAKTRADGCIDPKRVYATGLSNGGAMAHLLACRAADVFAATAPVSMGNGTMPCAPARPVSVIMYRGTMDPLVAYGGGFLPSAQADFDQWKMLDGCTGAATATNGVCQTYAGCKGGVEVTLCSIASGHVLYADAALAGAAVADVAWTAFARQPLP